MRFSNRLLATEAKYDEWAETVKRIGTNEGREANCAGNAR